MQAMNAVMNTIMALPSSPMPNRVIMKSRAIMAMKTPPVLPVMSIIASIRPESLLIWSVGMAAPMPKAQKI